MNRSTLVRMLELNPITTLRAPDGAYKIEVQPEAGKPWEELTAEEKEKWTQPQAQTERLVPAALADAVGRGRLVPVTGRGGQEHRGFKRVAAGAATPISVEHAAHILTNVKQLLWSDGITRNDDGSLPSRITGPYADPTGPNYAPPKPGENPTVELPREWQTAEFRMIVDGQYADLPQTPFEQGATLAELEGRVERLTGLVWMALTR